MKSLFDQNSIQGIDAKLLTDIISLSASLGDITNSQEMLRFAVNSVTEMFQCDGAVWTNKVASGEFISNVVNDTVAEALRSLSAEEYQRNMQIQQQFSLESLAKTGGGVEVVDTRKFTEVMPLEVFLQSPETE